jgi:CRP-like cAMP-binding protein
VASSVVSPAGRRALLEVLGPGDLATGGRFWPAGGSCGEDQEGEPDPVRPELRALGPAQVVVILGADLAGETDPGVLAWLHRRALVRLHRSQAALADALTMPVRERLHRLLVGLAKAHGRGAPGGTRIAIPLTQDALAAAVGATRETANRALRALEAEGLLRRIGRTYTLLDEPAIAPA